MLPSCHSNFETHWSPSHRSCVLANSHCHRGFEEAQGLQDVEPRCWRLYPSDTKLLLTKNYSEIQLSTKNITYILSGFKKALLQNPREMIRGQIFSGMIRIRARKSELQAESRSYRPKVGDTAQNPNRIVQKRAPNGV